MFDRHIQAWQCSIITDCRGDLSWFCKLAVPTVWWLLWGTAHTKSKSSTFPWAGWGEVLLIASLDMILLKKQITKLLMTLRVCTGWSAPLLYKSPKTVFSVAVQLIYVILP